MDNHEGLAERFEANRTHLRAVAYRILGSLSEGDDAVHERRALTDRDKAAR
jgi:DNA-directed RNA polymerase specialized sigma24 family protein